MSQQEKLFNSLATAVQRLPNSANRLAPAEDLLNAFALALTDGVAGPACRTAVNRGVHQHAFAANRMRDLQQQRSNKHLRRDAKAAALGVALVHARENRVH